jgi:hypothetical protein
MKRYLNFAMIITEAWGCQVIGPNIIVNGQYVFAQRPSGSFVPAAEV